MLQGPCSRTDEHPAATQPNPAEHQQEQTRGQPMHFTRITHDPAVMGGRPCIRGLRITVATIPRIWPLGVILWSESRVWS